MTAADYLAAAERKYPHLFTANKVQLRPEALRRLIVASFEAGERAWVDRQREMYRESDVPEFMKGLFK